MIYQCVVIDDEEPARALLEAFIGKIPALKLKGSFSGPLGAMSTLLNEKIDVVFLDILMPEMSGVEFLKGLSSKPVVVFITASKDFAVEGYQLDVVDYLLKPYTFEQFFRSVNKAIEKVRSFDLDIRPRDEGKQELDQKYRYFVVSAGNVVHKIALNEVEYIEGLGEYVVYQLSDGRRIMSLDSLKRIAEEYSEEFQRVHKSYIVSISKVESLKGNILLVGRAKIPLGRSFKDQAVKKIFRSE